MILDAMPERVSGWNSPPGSAIAARPPVQLRQVRGCTPDRTEPPAILMGCSNGGLLSL